MTLDPGDGNRRWLRRVDDHSAFAFARGHDFIRCSDQMLWAHLSQNQLISARSGDCLAYRVGDVFYDATTHAPLFYQPSRSPGTPGPGEVRAVRVTEHRARTARNSESATSQQ